VLLVVLMQPFVYRAREIVAFILKAVNRCRATSHRRRLCLLGGAGWGLSEIPAPLFSGLTITYSSPELPNMTPWVAVES
jgi:hypothetical protein